MRKRGLPPAERREIGLRLLALRKVHKGFNQTMMAMAVGVNQQDWSNYERGKNLPSRPTMHQIAKRLGVPIAWIEEGDTTQMDRGLLERILQWQVAMSRRKP